MQDHDTRRPLAALLATTAMGVYVLVVAGGTAAIADAAHACATWPVCRVPASLSEPALLVAWGHRLVAAAVGLLVVATAVVAFLRRTEVRGRVLAALAVALVLFPTQVAIGAFVAVDGPTETTTGAHLLVGMVIFSTLALALAWHLEPEDPADDGVDVDLLTGEGSGDFPGDAPDDAHPERPDDAHPERPDDAPPERPVDDSLKRPDDGPGDVRSPTPQVSDLSALTRARATAFAYFRLTKPRLMWLLCLVAAAGMALAPGPDFTVRTIVLTLGGGVLAIGASGTFNHVLERDRDKRMDRTSDRPVATHQLPARNALAFGLVLAAVSLALFAQLNRLAAALGLSAIVFYSVIYTLVLKPNTVQNTVIGGAAGALPALIGYAAVTGRVGLPGVALAAVIFLWTPAHFYNLALAYKEDYARGGFPMMPVVRGEAETRKHVLLYLAATLLSAVVLTAVTDLGWLYAATSSVFGGVFLWTVLRLHRERDESAAFRAFHASNAYLGALLLAVVVDAIAV